MDLGNNIYNAFEVVYKTHKNVDRLMDYFMTVAKQKGDYALASPKFLRWKSDNHWGGWNVTSFILLFQRKEDRAAKHGWRDGDIYVMEIDLFPAKCDEGGNEQREPIISLGRYIYEDNKNWSRRCSPADHWIFNHPRTKGSHYIPESLKEEGVFYGEVSDQNCRNKWWGLKETLIKQIRLTEINGNNAYEKIFGTFDKLQSIDNNIIR